MVATQNIIERIKAIKHLQSDKDVASLLGLSPADFSNRKRRDSLLPTLIEWAVEADISLDMLVRGAAKAVSFAEDELRGSAWNVYTLDSNGGPKKWLCEKPCDTIILSDKLADDHFLVIMPGDSMEPTIRNGAMLGVDYGLSKPIFVSGGIYVMWVPNEGPIVRRVFVDFDKIILHADNKLFPEITLSLKEVPDEDFLLGRVDWVLQKV